MRASALPVHPAFRKAVNPGATNLSHIHIWPLCSPGLALVSKSSYLESNLFTKVACWFPKMTQKEARSEKGGRYKRRGKKEEKKKDKKAKNGTEQSSALHLCHVLAHFIAFFSAAPASRQAECRNQAAVSHSAQAHTLLNENRAKSVTKCLAASPFPVLPALLFCTTWSRGRGSDAHCNSAILLFGP